MAVVQHSADPSHPNSLRALQQNAQVLCAGALSACAPTLHLTLPCYPSLYPSHHLRSGRNWSHLTGADVRTLHLASLHSGIPQSRPLYDALIQRYRILGARAANFSEDLPLPSLAHRPWTSTGCCRPTRQHPHEALRRLRALHRANSGGQRVANERLPA